MSDVSLVVSCGCDLGEGPVWIAGDNCLRFVDILSGKLHSYWPERSVSKIAEVGGAPSFILPAVDGRFVVGSGSVLFWSDGHRLQDAIVRVGQPAGNRLNDATVGPDGTIWFGSMNEGGAEPTGTIWSFGRDGLRQTDVCSAITNGPVVSADGRFFYFADSTRGIIWRYEIQNDRVLGNPVDLIRIPAKDGAPDGVVLDAEGCLWVAMWDGWAVHRYAPDGGLLKKVCVPVARPTKLAFAGKDLRVGYITSARMGLAASDLRVQSHAGGLFSFKAEVPGRLSCLADI